jgi:hypothetical protein
VNLKVEDYYPSGKRFLLRFKEKGGKEKELPVHHKLEELLDQYLKITGLEKEPQSPLFPASIDTQNDDLLVKMPSFEQILCRGRFRHPGSYRTIPSLSTVCTRTFW